MRKKFVTSALTLGVATALVAGNGVVSTFAYSTDDAQKVEVIGQHQQPENTSTNLVSKVKIAHKRTSQDMNEEEAIEITKKVIEEKFKVSLNGAYASPTFCIREDKEGTFYFVTFDNNQIQYSDEEITQVKEKIKAGKDVDYKIEIYSAFVNSKTGEIDYVEKNSTAPEGVN